MKKLLVMILASLLLAACGGAGTGSGSKSGPQKIELTVYGKTQTFEPKTGMMTVGQTGSDETYGEYGIHLGNVELKTSEDVNKTLTSTEDVRLSFALARKQGTDRKTPVAVETFPVNGHWPHINDASVKTFDGNRMVESWGHEAPNMDWKGEVKITAVNGDMVSGEVDLKFGDKISIKGPFTVKVLR
jgi:hypothetical protein